MNSKILASALCFSMFFMAIAEGMRGFGMEPRCRCIETESRRIGKLIKSVEMFSPNSHCKNTEIIATLKRTGQEVCLDTTAPWVKKVIEKILSNKKP